MVCKITIEKTVQSYVFFPTNTEPETNFSGINFSFQLPKDSYLWHMKNLSNQVLRCHVLQHPAYLVRKYWILAMIVG